MQNRMHDITFFWHDYETFGIDPQRDRVCQFAGVRTDIDLNVIDEPVMAYCRPGPDYLPHPEACLITGITPQTADAQGIGEAGFAALVHNQLAQANTCALGYNSLRFDDEVTRNLLYRNFYDPYAREWQHGNSRWDLIDVARATQALRPDGLEWPRQADGSPSFRLEELTVANGIAHADAHDALADVHATIAVARLIKQRQPRLYRYLFENRGKHAVQSLLQLGSFTPLVHVSGRFPARNNCLAVIVPLCLHPGNQNEVVTYDLSVDPGPLLDLPAEDIRLRVFTAADALPAGTQRVPLKTIHINKCPVLAPLTVIRPADAERLALDLARCRTHLARIQAAPGLTAKLAAVYATPYAHPVPTDPELMIYSGGFFNDRDRQLMTAIRAAPPTALADFRGSFQDPRLKTMLFRYRARNFPETLTAAEQEDWQKFCRLRLAGGDDGSWLSMTAYLQKIRELSETNRDRQHIFTALESWAGQLRTACTDAA